MLLRGLHFTSLAASGTDESGLNSARSSQATDPLTPLRRRDDSPSLSEFKESRKKLVPKRKRCRRRLNRSSAIRSSERARTVIRSLDRRTDDLATWESPRQRRSPIRCRLRRLLPRPPATLPSFFTLPPRYRLWSYRDRERQTEKGNGTKNGKVANAIAFLSLRLEGEGERESRGLAMNEENSQRR